MKSKFAAVVLLLLGLTLLGGGPASGPDQSFE